MKLAEKKGCLCYSFTRRTGWLANRLRKHGRAGNCKSALHVRHNSNMRGFYDYRSGYKNHKSWRAENRPWSKTFHALSCVCGFLLACNRIRRESGSAALKSVSKPHFSAVKNEKHSVQNNSENCRGRSGKPNHCKARVRLDRHYV